MNVLLVQPTDPPEPIKPTALTAEPLRLMAPSWDLLCLQAYMLERTKHVSTYVDCRLFSDLENELVQAIKQLSAPRALVINATSHALGQTAAVLAIAKRNFPEIITILCGEFPSQFPERVASMPSVDYALSGDPEPILRSLLDHIELPQRLRRVPGLIYSEAENTERSWLPRLHSLATPSWDDILWSAYRRGIIRAEVRISRGHTHAAGDRAFGCGHEPLRIWPMDRIAKVVHSCGHLGVSEVVLTDPPGVWTTQRLGEWCSALRYLRNRQPWCINLLPQYIDDDLAANISSVGCRRVELILPSCDGELLERYEALTTAKEIKRSMAMLRSHDIDVHLNCWFGGPEESGNEQERVLQMITALGFVPASLHPFPFAMHSMLYAALCETATMPHLEDWIQWSRDPWTSERPLPLWGGQASIPQFEEAVSVIKKTLAKSPKHHCKRILTKLRSTNWIRSIEDWTVDLIVGPTQS